MTSAAPELAALCLLTSLPDVGPARLRWLLHATSAPEVVDALRRGRLPRPAGEIDRPRGVSDDLCRRWFDAAAGSDGVALLTAHRRAGVTLLTPDDRRWPFAADPDPPAVLFATGDPDHLSATGRVAVVGTRRSTGVGRQVAFGLGRDLTDGGFSVVSGLALGIDGAAHRGALAAGADSPAPIGVVAGGLDHVYPPRHRDLWTAVAERGVLISECPLGVRPDRWRFPARNRLIAGLSHLLIVVESHARGGALLTVDEAADRGVPVAAVPGSVLSDAAAGTNALLVDGCPPVRGADDVFDLLGGRRRSPDGSFDRPDRPPDPLVAAVLAELSNGELHLERLLGRLTPRFEMGLPGLIGLLRRLERAGLVVVVGNRVRRPES